MTVTRTVGRVLMGQKRCYRRRSVPCVIDKPLMAVYDELGGVVKNNDTSWDLKDSREGVGVDSTSRGR